MIVLCCKYCESSNLRPLQRFYEAFCFVCNRELALWQMKPMLIIETKVETTEQNLSKIRVK